MLKSQTVFQRNKTRHPVANSRHGSLIILAIALICCSAGACRPSASHSLQGYVEGDYLSIASSGAGTLTSLFVGKGDNVEEGKTLFSIDDTPEQSNVKEAENRLRQAQANLEDLQKGQRPTELEMMKAQVMQAKAALTLSEKEVARQERINRTASGAVSQLELDRARANRERDAQKLRQLQAELETAALGGRIDQIRAAESNTRALEAALEAARWALRQKQPTTPKSGRVFDTLFRVGEWVGAGRPVVVVLPPENIKVRTFIGETDLSKLRLQNSVRVFVDGQLEPLLGKISFISPHAEYTPPVIYSRENREKLVFMVEISFEPKVAERLHPGQPVDVQIDL